MNSRVGGDFLKSSNFSKNHLLYNFRSSFLKPIWWSLNKGVTNHNPQIFQKYVLITVQFWTAKTMGGTKSQSINEKVPLCLIQYTSAPQRTAPTRQPSESLLALAGFHIGKAKNLIKGGKKQSRRERWLIIRKQGKCLFKFKLPKKNKRVHLQI